MLRHTRTPAYLLAAGAIWFAEDVVFTRAFGFNAGQSAVVTIYFLALFVGAILFAVKTYRRAKADGDRGQPSELSIDRIIAVAPVLTVIVGSFAALPIIVLVLIGGYLL